MKILYFYPENPLLLIQGNNARANKLLDYFNSKGIEVDFVGEKSKSFTIEDANKLKDIKKIREVFLLNGLNRRENRLKYLFLSSIPKKFKNQIKSFNRLLYGHEFEFQNILKKKQYDIIIISYSYWSKLIDNIQNLNGAKTYIDTHDFLTSQFQNDKNFKLGRYFETEINILNKFDEIFVISPEEKYIFSQFINKPIHLVTHCLQAKNEKAKKKYDLIYVASDNEHNTKSIKWFLNEVYPLLPDSIKILCIGRITKSIDDKKNIEKINFAENLDMYYSESKLVICPMLSGTGLKIKVVEGLSYGLPVVCTERGVDGLLNKKNNGCLVSDDPYLFSQNIINLLNNSEFYAITSSKARLYFNENHSIEAVYKSLDTIFKL